MKIVIIGMQGSGKGTQALKLQDKYGIEHISMGDLLRYHITNKTPIGIAYQEDYDKGYMASDDIIFRIIKEKIDSMGNKGYIVDGFPRTYNQLMWFDMHYSIDKCIYLRIHKKEAVNRLKARNRSDDNDKAISKRIADYYLKTTPIIRIYEKEKKLITVNANNSIEEVFGEISSKIGMHGKN